MNELDLKILLIGDSTVGKSSILRKFIDNKFEETSTSTIGVDFRFKIINKKEKKINLRIWDPSGQERYRSLTQNYYRNANGIIFIFDLTNYTTFENIQNWLTESKMCESQAKYLLVGNKVDLEEKKDKNLTKEIIETFAEKNNMKYYEISAKTGINIDKIFKKMVDLILVDKSEKEIKEKYIDDYEINDGSFIICDASEKPIKKKKCC